MFSISSSFTMFIYIFSSFVTYMQIFGDEVQPFSLDEEFDYDNVALTPKFTAAEMETIRELLKQERKNTNTDL